MRITSKEIILEYARGETQIKQPYLTFYDVSETGAVNIHSCERIWGIRNHLIRFCDFTGRKREPEIPEDAVCAEIERFVSNGKTVSA